MKRFQQVQSGANNCIFIRTTLDNPTELVQSIFSDIHESKVSKSRYIMRLLPVMGTCKCTEEKIKKLAESCLEKYFAEPIGHSFSVHVKVRNNNSISRKQILPVLVEVIKNLNSANWTDLSNPEYVVNVDIIRTICCLSVLKDFVKFRKFNIQEVSDNEKPRTTGPSRERNCDDAEKCQQSKDMPGTSRAVASKESAVKEEKPPCTTELELKRICDDAEKCPESKDMPGTSSAAASKESVVKEEQLSS